MAEKVFTVTSYLGLINASIKSCGARVQGEISSVDFRGKAIYFCIKDKDGSVLNCLIWKSNYDLLGVTLKEGLEIIVEGSPEIYKPFGKFNFKTSVIELVGEGALKDAYDKLKLKLEKEGVFAIEKKKLIPDFTQKVGLITSEGGAVIHDFLNNLGKYGYQTKFLDSRVEGQAAIKDLTAAIDYFSSKDIEVLVIIRGGGSLESLQAFNNELLVRKIAGFGVPVICGIGHDKDLPLASLAADVSVSTPTAVTTLLNKSWDKALGDIAIYERDLLYKFSKLLSEANSDLERLSASLSQRFRSITSKYSDLKYELRNALNNIGHTIKNNKKELDDQAKRLVHGLRRAFEVDKKALDVFESSLCFADPLRQLQLGYSIVSLKGKVIKNIAQIKLKDEVEIRVSDGKLTSEIKEIN
jgi:exodeoxyribonuclease VII large subunit